LQVFFAGCEELGLRTVSVKIVDAEVEAAVVGAGAFRGLPERPGVAEVQVACWRRRQPSNVLFHPKLLT
jgi:hypothetical protein